METQTSMKRIMSYLPQTSPHARDEVLVKLQRYNLCWKNVLMNEGTMIIALLSNGMRLGTMKQNCSTNFIALEKKQIPLSKAIQWFSLHVNSFLLAFIIIWVWNFMNQMYDVSVQKKDGDSITLNQDKHCFNVLKKTKKCHEDWVNTTCHNRWMKN